MPRVTLPAGGSGEVAAASEVREGNGVFERWLEALGVGVPGRNTKHCLAAEGAGREEAGSE